MIPKIKKILYATDLSKNSAYAFGYAVNSAEHHDAEIHILHVWESRLVPLFPGGHPGFEGSVAFPEIERDLEQKQKYYAEQKKLVEDSYKEMITRRLNDFCQKELHGNAALLKSVVSIEVVEGDPAAQILQKAEELPADVVIMGSHGKGLLAQAFLGSVAAKVLNRIKIPVYIIPIPKETDVIADLSPSAE
jgi:nucleotide-binding universal stress UspA family protein